MRSADQPNVPGINGAHLFLTAAERRRLVFATIVTLLALPTLWLVSRDEARDGSGVPSVAAVGAGGAVDAAGPATQTAGETPAATSTTGATRPVAEAAPEAEDDDPFGDTHPVFLDGPTRPLTPVVLDVAVPTTDATSTVAGHAAYMRSGVPDRCDTPHAPVNATIVVTNVNNGRTVTCRNTFTFGLASGLAVVLDEAAFLRIADLVDAPVPVRIAW